MLVVDASFAVQASLTAAGLHRLNGLEAVAPDLMWSEGVSVLHELAFRHSISRELADEAFERLIHAPIGRSQPARLHHEAWRIATRHGWAKTYDAQYVALAKLLNCPLLTVDARLASTAVRDVKLLRAADL